MSFLKNLKNLFTGASESAAKRRRLLHNVKVDLNPEEYWQLCEEVGDGAFGKVYKSVHRDTKQVAAAKVCEMTEDDELEGFMVEIDILTEMQHDNVIQLLDAYLLKKHLWMLLEFCDGGAVDSIMIELDRGLNEAQIAYVASGMVKGMEYLHNNSVIHRDIKAGNVLLTMNAGVKLTDFGVSAKDKERLQKHTTFIGTPFWMAPEVIICETSLSDPYDFRADIWSMGITMIEFAQKDPPYNELNPVRAMLRIQKYDPPRLDRPSRWSPEFNQFIAACLKKEPEQRATALQLMQMPFVNRDLDTRPIRELLLEYKADVVEGIEDVTEDDPRASRISLDTELSAADAEADETTSGSGSAPPPQPKKKPAPPPPQSPLVSTPAGFNDSSHQQQTPPGPVGGGRSDPASIEKPSVPAVSSAVSPAGKSHGKSTAAPAPPVVRVPTPPALPPTPFARPAVPALLEDDESAEDVAAVGTPAVTAADDPPTENGLESPLAGQTADSDPAGVLLTVNGEVSSFTPTSSQEPSALPDDGEMSSAPTSSQEPSALPDDGEMSSSVPTSPQEPSALPGDGEGRHVMTRHAGAADAVTPAAVDTALLSGDAQPQLPPPSSVVLPAVQRSDSPSGADKQRELDSDASPLRHRAASVATAVGAATEVATPPWRGSDLVASSTPWRPCDDPRLRRLTDEDRFLSLPVGLMSPGLLAPESATVDLSDMENVRAMTVPVGAAEGPLPDADISLTAGDSDEALTAFTEREVDEAVTAFTGVGSLQNVVTADGESEEQLALASGADGLGERLGAETDDVEESVVTASVGDSGKRVTINENGEAYAESVTNAVGEYQQDTVTITTDPPVTTNGDTGAVTVTTNTTTITSCDDHQETVRVSLVDGDVSVSVSAGSENQQAADSSPLDPSTGRRDHLSAAVMVSEPVVIQDAGPTALLPSGNPVYTNGGASPPLKTGGDADGIEGDWSGSQLHQRPTVYDNFSDSDGSDSMLDISAAEESARQVLDTLVGEVTKMQRQDAELEQQQARVGAEEEDEGAVIPLDEAGSEDAEDARLHVSVVSLNRSGRQDDGAAGGDVSVVEVVEPGVGDGAERGGDVSVVRVDPPATSPPPPSVLPAAEPTDVSVVVVDSTTPADTDDGATSLMLEGSTLTSSDVDQIGEQSTFSPAGSESSARDSVFSPASDTDTLPLASSTTRRQRPQQDAQQDDGDVVLRRKRIATTPNQTSDARGVSRSVSEMSTRSKEELALSAMRKKTRKRTRRFEIDGVVITTTTRTVYYGDDDSAFVDEHVYRKQEMRELKMLQKQEQNQFRDLNNKTQLGRDNQLRKFESEMSQLVRQYDADVDTLLRQHKSQMEKIESQHDNERRSSSKRIRSEQERELKVFRDSQKQEARQLKQRLEQLPKDQRREALRTGREKLDAEHQEKERRFIDTQNENHDSTLRRMIEQHRQNVAQTEKLFLQQKQQLLRAKESAIWELEERQIHEKHQMEKHQVKEVFFLQRHQMLMRHDKELEHVRRMNVRHTDEVSRQQQVDKRALPKRIRAERKARELMFRESMRISHTLPGRLSSLTEGGDERERLKQFLEQERKRYKAEEQRFELKHKRRMEELKARGESAIKELEQLHNEKRRMLMDHESLKLKSLEDTFQTELRDWRHSLKPRKQKLEETFTTESSEQERFFAEQLERGISLQDGRTSLGRMSCSSVGAGSRS